jgi:hypothetical protein
LVREDYFGGGEPNASFFSIPIGLAGGSGPNQYAIGTLGRNTFRGPDLRNFDIALIKGTPLARGQAASAPCCSFAASS